MDNSIGTGAATEISGMKNYDSQFCGSLPLNVINLIQPHGALLVLDNQFNIIQSSENIQSFTGHAAESLIGKPLSTLLDQASLNLLKERIEKYGLKDKIPLNLSLQADKNKTSVPSLTHMHKEYMLLELHSRQEETDHVNSANLYLEVKYIMSALNAAKTLEELTKTTTEEIRRLTGFDKIMIYRFDEDWSGTVVAESMETGMESYLGLRFPASDIPKQARELYLKNPYRMIPNRSFQPVRLYPVINPLTNTFTDLGDCTLRGVAAVHTEYLKNMNVTASMSVRILKDNSLWGLIACHHRSEKNLSYEMCTAFEVLSNYISSRISALENEKSLMHGRLLGDMYSRLLERTYSRDNLVTGLTEPDPSMMDLLDLSGMAVIYNKKISVFGKTPNVKAIEGIVDWIRINGIEKTYFNSSFPSSCEDAVSFKEVASGLMVIEINSRKNEFILGFRPEVVEIVNWGGNPNEAIRFEADRKNYHPRNSFSIWQQAVKNTSLPWLEGEKLIAEKLRSSILDFIIKSQT